MKLNLNFSFDSEGELQKSKDKVKKATDRKKASEETLEEAIVRIKQLKGYQTDQTKMDLVIERLLDKRMERHIDYTGKKLSVAECLRYYTQVQAELRVKKIKELIAKTPQNYKLITSMNVFNQVMDDAEKEVYLPIDTETSGLDIIFGNDFLVGVSITLPSKDLHYYLPLAHRIPFVQQLSLKEVFPRLKALLENKNIGKVLANAKFDLHVFEEVGIKMTPVIHDCLVAQHVLNENEKSFALKDLVQKYCGIEADTFSELFGKDFCFADLDLATALGYAAKDTHVTDLLYKFQMTHFMRLPKLYEYYMRVENPLIPVLVGMERTGFEMDIEYAKEYGSQLTIEIEQLRQNLVQYFGTINYNSSQQLKPVLEKIVGKKLDSTDAKKVLKPLAMDFEAIRLLLEYKDLVKLNSTYVDALPKKRKNDGRIHGNFGQINTDTGRLNSSGPNLQNLGKRARKLFIAPKGKVILSGDFSQQEPRILAHFTQEEALVQAYKDGKDLYATAAAELYGKTVEECGDGSQERKNMKFGILSVMYSTGPKTLASQIGTTEKVAKAFIDAFYAKYQKVGKWIEANNEFTAKNGYIEMLYGRKRRLADINSRDKWTRIKTERKVTNARIQGSAAIQTKLTMIAIYEWCLAHGYEMLFSIHDEIAVLVPETISREKIEEFNDIMINTVKLSIPNKSDVEISRRWAEGMSVDQYLTGVVNRDDFTKEKDYLAQKQIVENAWQEAIAN